MPPIRCFAPLLFAALAAPAAFAADPPAQVATETVTLRLVAERPGADGTVRGALLIDLAPGWKTYWLDPGDAGIPPALDASASRNLQPLRIGFPVPHRFGGADGASNGFSQPIAVALDFRLTDAGAPARIEIAATLGVCSEVCVPVEARLSVPVGPDLPAPADERLVAGAFDALPSPSTAEAGIVSAALSGDGQSIEVAARAAPGEEARVADLFVAGPKGWFFGAPKPPRRDGRGLVFAVPVTERPKAAGRNGPPAIDAVLTLGASAYGATALAVSP